jgi:uncharacterized membrane protein YbhN (UPF0104 family)
MKDKLKWTRIIYITGVISIIIGALDPLEGSILIMIGSALLALSAYITSDKHSKIFTVSLVMILIGVAFMFYFSSLGGFGGTSTLSWWWGLLILPFPIGWLTIIIVLIKRAIENKKLKSISKKLN